MALKHKKMTWAKESGFIFAMIGSAVGFANLLAFSTQCYKNGGGAFLIPFLAAILIIGLPMLLLEGTIGKIYGLPIASAYGKVLPKTYKIFGWIAALSCLTIGSFYAVLTSWSVTYTYFSAFNKIPYASAHFFQKEFLRDSGSLTNFNALNPAIALATFLVLFFSWYIMAKNIGEGVERVCSLFLPLLFAIIIIFTLVVSLLPGATDGFIYYLQPDFSKLKDLRLWRDVFGHVFFSFSLGIGIVVGYSRHTKQETNLRRAMLWVAVGDVLVSVISGFAIFGCIGFLSHQTGTPFQEIVKPISTFEIGFIIFPQILNTFTPWLRPFLGCIFFFSVFIAGITGVFSIIESVAGNLEMEFNISRKQSVTLTTSIMFLLALFFCAGNGTHILGALTPMVMGYTFLIGGMAQIIVFMFVDKKIQNNKIFLNNLGQKGLLFITTKYFGLGFLIISFIGALLQELQEDFSANHFVRWGWFLAVVIISFILSQLGKTQNIGKT